MRIVIITDSLGVPRPNEGVDVECSWVDRVLKEYSGKEDVWFYTFCRPGAGSKDIIIGQIKELRPDLIITQIGVVDALRRALSTKENIIIARIPGVNRLVHWFCKKHHYFMTRIRSIHFANKEFYAGKILQLSEIAKCYFMPIIVDHDYYSTVTFHTVEDVNDYNGEVRKHEGANLVYLDPMEEGTYTVKDIILGDGHHLNRTGNDVWFESVKRIIDLELNNADNYKRQ